MYKEIVIVQWENTGVKIDSKIVSTNKRLSDAIDSYFDEELHPLGLRVLLKDNNVIITDVMCYAALFEEDLKNN